MNISLYTVPEYRNWKTYTHVGSNFFYFWELICIPWYNISMDLNSGEPIPLIRIQFVFEKFYQLCYKIITSTHTLENPYWYWCACDQFSTSIIFSQCIVMLFYQHIKSFTKNDVTMHWQESIQRELVAHQYRYSFTLQFFDKL